MKQITKITKKNSYLVISVISNNRIPTLYEELNSLTFPDHTRNFSLTKLTCNSYFSQHFSWLLLPYTDSLCYHSTF